MAQVKIEALRSTIATLATSLSDAIHAAIMQALAYAAEKRFERFLALDPEDFIFPPDRSSLYVNIETSRSACSRADRSRRRMR